MSFSAGKHSESGIVLRHLLTNTKPVDFHGQLAKAANGGIIFPSDVDLLLYVIKNSGIVITPSQLAAKDVNERHCVRCHNAYLERDNGLTSCVIPHMIEQTTVTENGKSTIVNHVRCCGERLQQGSMPVAHCVDRHTTVFANVHYDGLNVRPCVPDKCFPAAQRGQVAQR
jgi:hypothetical protein